VRSGVLPVEGETEGRLFGMVVGKRLFGMVVGKRLFGMVVGESIMLITGRGKCGYNIDIDDYPVKFL